MCELRVARAYINRKTREEKRRKEGARDRGIGRRGREKEKEWRGKEKRSKKRGKEREGGVVEKEGRKGTGERRDRKERRKDTQEETQGYADEHRCTQMHTDAHG